MSELYTDVRYAIRSLRKSPAFALVTILTLALGIGANSAIFSVLNGVVLRPLPYGAPERLVRIASQFPTLGFDEFWLSPPELMELQERNRTLLAVAGYRTGEASVGGDEAPLRVTSAIATHELFEVLGVPPLRGRPFNAQEDAPNTAPVVVLSWELWQRAFGGSEDVLGRQIRVNGSEALVTGIMPPGFDVADAGVEVWLPAALDRSNRENRGSHYLDVIARLRPGATLGQAEADLSRLVAEWGTINPSTHVPAPDNHPMFMTALQEDLVSDVRPALMLLLGAVGFVLLIACANVANLLLARAESRQREIAVRAAIGAGRGRLLRQFLTEGVVLALLGGAFGLALGWVGVRVLMATNPDAIPRAETIGIDATVLLFTLAVSVVTGLIFGLAPALNLGPRVANRALRDGSGRTTAGSFRQQLRRALVVSEVAPAVMLVVGSGLMLRSFAALQAVDPGFRPDGLLSFQLFLPAAGYSDGPAQDAFYDRLLPELRALPGVVSVSTMSGLPPRRDLDANDTEFEGLPQTPDSPPQNVDYYQFTSLDYLETMGIGLVAGRGFEAPDEAGAPAVLVNERLVDVFFPGQDPIGRRIRPFGSDQLPWFTVVGVVRDVKQGGIAEETGTELYFFYPQGANTLGFAPRTMNIVLRTTRDPLDLAGDVRNVVRSADPTLPIANLAPMDDVLHASMAQPRFLTLLLGIFAGVALALAAIGTYGVMAYSVEERRQEFGIRMALGAHPSSVLTMVLRQGLVVAAVGLLLGMVGAGMLTRLLRSLLYQVSTTDTAAFMTAPLLLGAVAVVACLVPARRATRVDPARVLKSD
ncbi:MAG TPA: ABC transporter permease [Longimicrobiales bacterium]|nr:ABC transporter permease [Longimicrobiales bacterium]